MDLAKAVSTEKPELITKAAVAVKSAKNKTKLLCGAGIVSGEDVSKAVELGSKGILVASGIVKSKNWDKIIVRICQVNGLIPPFCDWLIVKNETSLFL